MDPSHFYFLHSMAGNVDFATQLGMESVGHRDVEWDYMETPVGMVSIDSRRIGDFVWVLVSDYIFPNINQMPELSKHLEGGKSADGSPNKGSWLTWWTVPIDDTSCMHIGFWWANEDEDRGRETGFGQSDQRSYQERQQVPGDYDAQVSQRPIEVHALEHLATTDRGIIMLRNMVRRSIRSVQEGDDPAGIPYPGQDAGAIPSYVLDKVMRVPPAPTPEEDRRLLRDLGRQVAEESLKSPPPPLKETPERVPPVRHHIDRAVLIEPLAPVQRILLELLERQQRRQPDGRTHGRQRVPGLDPPEPGHKDHPELEEVREEEQEPAPAHQLERSHARDTEDEEPDSHVPSRAPPPERDRQEGRHISQVYPLVEGLIVPEPAQVQQVHHEQVGEIDQDGDDGADEGPPEHRQRAGYPNDAYDQLFRRHR